MDEQHIIEVAEEVTNGSTVEIKYLKPAEVYTKRNFAKREGVPQEELPKVKEGGNDPCKVLYKRTTYSFAYDQRPYFQQCLEEQAQNLNPVKDEEYTHIRGAHYTKPDKEGVVKDYIRFTIRADRLEVTARYTTDKRGRNEVEYEDIEKYLKESAREGYESYNRQTDEITSTGRVAKVEIIQQNLRVDRITKIAVA